jgi:hypothetical protein
MNANVIFEYCGVPFSISTGYFLACAISSSILSLVVSPKAISVSPTLMWKRMWD